LTPYFKFGILFYLIIHIKGAFMSSEKSVDQSWKETANQEKQKTDQTYQEHNTDYPEFNFMTYITSLSMQALIFLGVIGNPMNDNQVEVNLDQARLLIDTLAILKEKTKGNLNKEEEGLLNASVYELQLKYVELAGAAKEEGKIIHGS